VAGALWPVPVPVPVAGALCIRCTIGPVTRGRWPVSGQGCASKARTRPIAAIRAPFAADSPPMGPLLAIRKAGRKPPGGSQPPGGPKRTSSAHARRVCAPDVRVGSIKLDPPRPASSGRATVGRPVSPAARRPASGTGRDRARARLSGAGAGDGPQVVGDQPFEWEREARALPQASHHRTVAR
jgi:hypothetical protein